MSFQTSDGSVFAKRVDAVRHQRVLDGCVPVSAAQEMTLLGVKFILAPGRPDGEYHWSDADTSWVTSEATYSQLRASSNDDVAKEIRRLREAQRRREPVVKARVTENRSRPQATPRQRKGDLSDLAERTQRMVVQIATMSDKGPIPDGQVAELSKSYAALQAEFDETLGYVEAIKDNLSIMRAIMFEHSDPRNATDAIA